MLHTAALAYGLPLSIIVTFHLVRLPVNPNRKQNDLSQMKYVQTFIYPIQLLYESSQLIIFPGNFTVCLFREFHVGADVDLWSARQHHHGGRMEGSNDFRNHQRGGGHSRRMSSG